MIYSICRAICLLLFSTIFRLEVRGREHIPAKGSFVLASNHVSYLDPPVVGVSCVRKAYFIAKQELFEFPVLSWLLPRINVLPVKRSAGDYSALKRSLQLLKTGEPLVVFPEGRRREKDCVALPAQPGIGFIAVKAGVPIIPVCVQGTEKALPKGARCIVPAKIRVSFGQQLTIDTAMAYEDIARLVMERIQAVAKNS
jgi:1-acyl-sn-glycerol-3-phosphate acyltransferase